MRHLLSLSFRQYLYMVYDKSDRHLNKRLIPQKSGQPVFAKYELIAGNEDTNFLDCIAPTNLKSEPTYRYAPTDQAFVEICSDLAKCACINLAWLAHPGSSKTSGYQATVKTLVRLAEKWGSLGFGDQLQENKHTDQIHMLDSIWPYSETNIPSYHDPAIWITGHARNVNFILECLAAAASSWTYDNFELNQQLARLLFLFETGAVRPLTTFDTHDSWNVRNAHFLHLDNTIPAPTYQYADSLQMRSGLSIPLEFEDPEEHALMLIRHIIDSNLATAQVTTMGIRYTSLMQIIYSHLAEIYSDAIDSMWWGPEKPEKIWVRHCHECERVLVTNSRRQKFCPSLIRGARSTCNNTFNKRRTRARHKKKYPIEDNM